MLDSLGLEPLEECGRVARLVLLNKILLEEVLRNMGYTKTQATKSHVTKDKLLAPSGKTAGRSNHFLTKTITKRNQLLESNTSTDSIKSFKSRLLGVCPP